MEVPQKIKNSSNISGNSTSGYISKGNENRLSKTHLYSHVHCSVIHSICTQYRICIYTRRHKGLLFRNKRKWVVKPPRDTEEQHIRIAKWKKLVWKATTVWFQLHDSFGKCKTVETVKRSVVARVSEERGECQIGGAQWTFRMGEQSCMILSWWVHNIMYLSRPI